jgi:hypothetical protein
MAARNIPHSPPVRHDEDNLPLEISEARRLLKSRHQS